jgi:hypothetical protein
VFQALLPFWRIRQRRFHDEKVSGTGWKNWEGAQVLGLQRKMQFSSQEEK